MSINHSNILPQSVAFCSVFTPVGKVRRFRICPSDPTTIVYFVSIISVAPHELQLQIEVGLGCHEPSHSRREPGAESR